MPRYLVELYLSGRDAAAELEARARVAAEALANEGERVQYVRTVFLPTDETCFQVYDAVSAGAVEEASRRAGISFDRIVEAVEP